MTDPTWTLDEVIEQFEKYESTLADDDLQALAWLRKLKADNAAFSRRNAELELEVRRVKEQRERLRNMVEHLALRWGDRLDVAHLLEETSE